ncbi:MAG: hypothetical protein MRK01_09895 [Candidatus Scalindua sp.]|nr:hypothetical protein [Candidatus Scalindua sp.]
MVKKFVLGLAFIGALVFGVCAVNTLLVGSVMASHEEGHKCEKCGHLPTEPENDCKCVCHAKCNKVDIVQVPAVVKSAIEKETAGGTVKEIVKKEADGKVCYAVKYVEDGMEKTAKFTEEGAVVECTGEKVEIAQVPAVVKAAIEKETAGGTVKEIVKKEADGKVCYAVKYVEDGMEKTLKLTEEGKRQ